MTAPFAASAQGFDGATRELAQKIAGIAGSGSKVLLDTRNICSLSPAEAARASQSLEAELRNAGLQLVKAPPADAEAHVTLAENLQGFLWVAHIRRGEIEQVVMVAVAHPQPGAQPPAAPALVLHKQFIWSQSAPILDSTLLPVAPDGMPGLLVLEPERVAFYRFDESRWQFLEAAEISHQTPWPRDVRGRLSPIGDNVQVSMPGITCRAFTRRTLVLLCEADTSGDGWLHGPGEEGATASFLSARNFFNGMAGPASDGKTKLQPFFAAAVVKEPENRRIILTGLDGLARLYENSPQPAATFAGWGSEIAALGIGCDATWQVLVTRPGDWTQPDAVQAYEIIERQAVAVSQPVEFDGPVTALWPSSDGKSVSAVVRNLKTGQYEAYTLSISCSR